MDEREYITKDEITLEIFEEEPETDLVIEEEILLVHTDKLIGLY